MLKKLYYRLFKRYRRLELRSVNYIDADTMIREGANKPEHLQWRIAPEEDANFEPCLVWLERRVRITG